MKILGVIMIGVIYGTFHLFSGVFKDGIDGDIDYDQCEFGLKVIVVALCAMMLLGALTLIFGGGAS